MDTGQTSRRACISVVLMLTAFPRGALALPEVSTAAKIQINVPDGGTRTRLITFDVTDQRHIFFAFLKSTERTGMCNPTDVLKYNSAAEVMSVSFWGEDVGRRITLKILQDTTGKWITTGLGAAERYDDPQGFPKYKYNGADLLKIQDWYKANIETSPRGKDPVEPGH